MALTLRPAAGLPSSSNWNVAGSPSTRSVTPETGTSSSPSPPGLSAVALGLPLVTKVSTRLLEAVTSTSLAPAGIAVASSAASPRQRFFWPFNS